MCGIAVVLGSDQPPAFALRSALDTLAHRGPDDAGEYRDTSLWLGSRRLAIQDLSDAGHMPMHADGVVSIVFNGEIYNYVEIRDELSSLGHRFASATDTEVLLRAYLQWGASCLSRLNGMWAFAIWDQRDRSLFVARDRFGVKPLYFSNDRDRTIFASEPKFILALSTSRPDVNERALYELLVEKRVDVSRQSFYRTIDVFPAGSYATVRPGDTSVRAQRYWRYPQHDEARASTPASELADEFEYLLEDSVRLRLRSDVPVGLTLSGGLDSTAILSATQRIEPDRAQSAFTSIYRGSGAVDERTWARIAVAPYRHVHLDEVDTQASDWLETLGRIVWHMDGPGLSPAVFPLWRIMQRARAERIPVLLEGQGADELLGGYAIHRAHALLDRAAELRRNPRAAGAHGWLRMLRSAYRANGVRRTAVDGLTVTSPALERLRSRYVGVREALDPDFVSRAEAVGPWPTTAETAQPAGNRLATKLHRDFSSDMLPAFLHYGDAISMAHSIESRLPFLDYRIVEFCARLPTVLRGGGDHSKEVLRGYLRTAGQSAIAERTDKKGYPTPAARWLAADDGRIPRELLTGTDAKIAQYIDRAAVSHLIDRQSSGRYAASDQLYALVTTEMWLRTCVHAAA